MRCQTCGRDFKGKAYGYPLRRGKRKGCFCDPLCARRWLHDSHERHVLIILPQVKREGGTYLLPPPRLLTWFGGPLPYDKWKKEQVAWEAPLCPQPVTVCVLGDAVFSTIKKPNRKLGRKLFGK